MDWPYDYTPYLWMFLGSAIFLAAMGLYTYRNRTVPGAVPFIILLSGIMLLVLGNAFGQAGNDDLIRTFWFKFNSALLLPIVTAALCFALEYAGLGKWVSRRAVLVLAILPFVYILLILTNHAHHLVWRQLWFDRIIQVEGGPAFWAAFFYGYFLSLLHLIVLAWLFARSPRHRWIAFWLILSPFIIRAAYLLKIMDWNLIVPFDPMLVMLNFALLPYALAIFRFHMFDVAPVVRDTVMERMADGLIVLDGKNRVADLNKKAEEILRMVRSNVVGREGTEILQEYPELVNLIRDSNRTQGEVFSGADHSRWYQISISPVIDRRGFHLGRLFLFHDITEQRRSQAQLLDYQRTLTMLKEREKLGRELHDGIGQLLAAAQLQVQTSRALLAKGDTAAVESGLDHLSHTIQQAKESVREYLLGVKTASSTELSLFSRLSQYLTHYSHHYGIHSEIVVSPELEQLRFDSAIEAQLQPIIQEALVNVRKHSESPSVRLIFARCADQVRVTVEDDGKGFDPEQIDELMGFGVRSMRGRAEALGAAFAISSALGQGTQVTLQVPWPKVIS
jgi:PAS domain S-box-containing protein